MAKKSLNKNKKVVKLKIKSLVKRPVTVIFLLLFTIVGAVLLFKSFAASPYTYVTGFVDRQNVPNPLYITAGQKGSVYDYPGDSNTEQIDWKAIQPVANGPLNVSQINADIVKNPNVLFKLRINTGDGAPDWLKTATGGGVSVCTTAALAAAPNCRVIPRFWTSQFKAAYDQLQMKLAAVYNNNNAAAVNTQGAGAHIGEIGMTACMTVFSEPLIRAKSYAPNSTAYKNAGYTEAASEQCLRDGLMTHKTYWTQKPTAMWFHPAEKWNDSTKTFYADNDRSITTAMMQTCRNSSTGPGPLLCVLGHNGFMDQITARVKSAGCSGNNANSSTASFTDDEWLYAQLKCMGKPLALQTKSEDKIAAAKMNIKTMVAAAASIGVMSIELPNGYNQGCVGHPSVCLSTSDISALTPSLTANKP